MSSSVATLPQQTLTLPSATASSTAGSMSTSYWARSGIYSQTIRPDEDAEEGEDDELVDFASDDADEDVCDSPPDNTLSSLLDEYLPNTRPDIPEICLRKPPYARDDTTYPTCGLRCADQLENSNAHSSLEVSSRSLPTPPKSPSGPRPKPTASARNTLRAPTRATTNNLSGSLRALTLAVKVPQRAPITLKANNTCVVCVVKRCVDERFVTCVVECLEKLCKTGALKPNMCNYCHRQKKVPNSSQCGASCMEKALLACLLCRSRPKLGQYHYCGRTCREVATKSTPGILEAVSGHVTFNFVERQFRDAWKLTGAPIPVIKSVFKIIESAAFLRPYDRYKRNVGNEVFRYHGTTRGCTLGTSGAELCENTSCSLCCILRTSFKTSLANPSGAFGPGIYSSSASSKAYNYTSSGSGAMLLTKVILGNVRTVQGWNEVMSCPPGFHSVVFDRQGGMLNETVVYSDDAIRPVFLIIF